MKGESFIIVLGKVAYADVFGDIHETAICRLYDGGEGTFPQHGGDQYNYRT